MANVEKTEYEVVSDGPILGDFYKRGEKISLFPRQAKYLVEPFDTRLKAVDIEVKEQVSAAQPSKKESDRKSDKQNGRD